MRLNAARARTFGGRSVRRRRRGGVRSEFVVGHVAQSRAKTRRTGPPDEDKPDARAGGRGGAGGAETRPGARRQGGPARPGAARRIPTRAPDAVTRLHLLNQRALRARRRAAARLATAAKHTRVLRRSRRLAAPPAPPEPPSRRDLAAMRYITPGSVAHLHAPVLEGACHHRTPQPWPPPPPRQQPRAPCNRACLHRGTSGSGALERSLWRGARRT